MTEDYLIDELEQQELSIAEAERILLELEDILKFDYSYEDIQHMGYVGLIKAVDRFDETKGK